MDNFVIQQDNFFQKDATGTGGRHMGAMAAGGIGSLGNGVSSVLRFFPFQSVSLRYIVVLM